MIRPVRKLLYILPMEDPSGFGKIVMPENHRKTADQGIVKYRGPGTSGEIKVGDHVVFSPWEGDVINLEGEGRLVLLPESAVDMVLGEGNNRMLTVSQIHNSIQRAAGEMAALTRDVQESQKIFDLARRFQEHLNDRFFDELVR